MTSRAQKLYKKLLDPEPSRRLNLSDIDKYLEDKWLRKGANKLEDEQSQLTLGSFQVYHILIIIYIYSFNSVYILYYTLYNIRVFIPTFVRRIVYCTHCCSMVSYSLLNSLLYII